MSDRPLVAMEPPGAHPVVEVLRAHAAGRLGADAATRVDLHLERCYRCRYAVNEAVVARHAARDEANLLAIAGALDAPRHHLVERALVGLGAPVDTVRLMLATPALRRSWFIGITVAVLFGMGAASPNRPDATLLVFLAVAPLIPMLGVALAYGPGVDPSYEMTLATPMSGIRLVLIRAVAVLVASIAIVGTATLLLLPRHSLIVAAWIVPALALSLVCLALLTVLSARVAVTIVALGWIAVLVVGAGAAGELAVFNPPGQIAFVVVGAIGALALAARRRAFDLSRGDLE